MLYVSDVKRSVEFYETLGFERKELRGDFGLVGLGAMEIQFHDKQTVLGPYFLKESLAEPKGGGLFIYVRVSKVDAYYRSLLEEDVVTSTEPRDWPWGNREFVVRDPDRYKLVFYEKI